jgi:excisionase family DNA binding protein
MKTTQITNETALFSIEEACHFLGIGRTKFWELRKDHKIPEVRLLGRNPRFLRADLEAVIARTRTVTTVTEYGSN